MTCIIILFDAPTVYELWTATRPECSDWLTLLKWAHQSGGWMEWVR